MNAAKMDLLICLIQTPEHAVAEYKGGGTVSPTITATQGDICKMEKHYKIRKLTPRECGRLMGVSDENIDKMLAVNSNSQCYKQFGNSIVVPVLMALFSQMNIDGIKPWNEMSEDEIYKLIEEHQ